MESKQCVKCLQEKSLDSFYEHKGERTSSGYRINICSTCHAERSIKWAKENKDKVKAHRRKRNLKAKYGISVEEYDKMFEEQNGSCFICFSLPTRRRLSVDHNHTTGQVRRLLCDKCNLAIGLLEEDQERLEKVRRYLENFTS
jgi:hypothetical protein|tara:strand:- start:44 stop:472 length:429 start_codon:yes stop_codon:yes gene_type:complete